MAKQSTDILVRLAAEEAQRLDVFAQGPLLDIIERFRSHLLKEAARLAGNEPIDGNHLERAFARLLAIGSGPDWSVANRRRLHLIRRQISGVISPTESRELAELQAQADRHMHQVAPRPLEAMWELESELARRMPEES